MASSAGAAAEGGVLNHHAVAIPVPGQGHMNPLMRLCKTLAHDHGFTITFVTVGPMQQRMEERGAKSDGDAPSAPTRIRMTSIPLPETSPEVSSGFRMSLHGFMRTVEAGVNDALEDLIRDLSKQGPPVTCLISDALISTCTQWVADKLNLPRIVFFPSSQAFNLLFTHISSGAFPLEQALRAAQQRDQLPLQPVGVELPGLPRLMYRDLYSCKHLEDETEELTRSICENVSVALANERGLNTFVVNSFLELEGPGFQAQGLLSLADPSLPPVYPIGPLLEDLSSDHATNTSLWKEDHGCLSWLDTKAPHSVLYISFGSMTLVTKAQFEEFLAGLEASSQSFLLVFRPDLVDDRSYVSLPQDFHSRTRGLGYVVGWVPQLRVLAHPSVGGFLTHCGWNSTIEAIVNGVPMLCWPYFADQPLDARYIVEEWKVGLRVEASSTSQLTVGRADIERLIRTLMQSSQGEALRDNAARLSSLAKGCHLATGSSYKNIRAVIKKLA